MPEKLTTQKVIFLATKDGLDAVEVANPSRRILKNAHAFLLKNDPEMATAFADRFLSAGESTGRGRRSPEPGETRPYKPSNLKGTGKWYIRVPLDVIEHDGSSVDVKFGRGRIVIGKDEE